MYMRYMYQPIRWGTTSRSSRMLLSPPSGFNFPRWRFAPDRRRTQGSLIVCKYHIYVCVCKHILGYIYVYIHIMYGPEMGGTPNHPKLDSFSIDTYGFLGSLILRNPHQASHPSLLAGLELLQLWEEAMSNQNKQMG